MSESKAKLYAALAKAQAQIDPEAEAAAIREVLGQNNARPGRQHERVPLHQRLLRRIRYGATDCWHWLGPLNGLGYGRMTYQGRMQVVHRLAWLAWNGEIPAGMSVLHKCDNRCCINPDHLWLGTYSDNLKDCWDKGRHPGNRGRAA